MFETTSTLFQGKIVPAYTLAYVQANGFYAIAIGKNKITPEILDGILQNISFRLSNERIVQLKEFEKIFDQELSQTQAGDITLTAMYVSDDVGYFISRGSGKVMVSRNGMSQELIRGNNIASGFLTDKDVFAIGSTVFFDVISENKDVYSKLFVANTSSGNAQQIQAELQEKSNPGVIGMSVNVEKITEVGVSLSKAVISSDDDISEGDITKKEPSVSAYTSDTYPEEDFISDTSQEANFPEKNEPDYQDDDDGTLAPHQRDMPKKKKRLGKKVTIILAVVVCGLFIWSVMLGNARRLKKQFDEEAQKTASEVQTLIDKGVALTDEDPAEALKILEEATQLQEALFTKAKEGEYELKGEAAELDELIVRATESIRKTNKTGSNTYYEMSLIQKSAQAKEMNLVDGNLALLDSVNGKVYVVSIPGKAVSTFSDSLLRGAEQVAMHNDNVYVYNSKKGIIELVDGEKAKVVIEPDKEWKSVVDMNMFNGNIYLLSRGSNDVYKYLVAEEGYSKRLSYFTGSYGSLKDARGFSIDSTVFIAVADDIEHYLSGLRQKFDMKLPEADAQFDDIFTSAELDNVYVLDRSKGVIYILDKDGTFQKQIEADVIKSADDFVVDETEGILILSKNALYSIDPN